MLLMSLRGRCIFIKVSQGAHFILMKRSDILPEEFQCKAAQINVLLF